VDGTLNDEGLSGIDNKLADLSLQIQFIVKTHEAR
jgi:hypothetical protein